MKIKIIPIVMSAIALISCASLTSSIPDSSCARDIEIVAGPENRARYHVHKACEWWESQTDLPVNLHAVTVDISRGNTSKSRLYVYEDRAVIYVDRASDEWSRHLHHEIWHVLLWRARPDLPPDDHHKWMLDRRLCQPARLCGYWSPRDLN